MEKTEVKSSKRCCLTSDALNSYGFRVLTDGVDLSLYERNPVLLYMHRRGDVIGYIDGLERSGGKITGELVFDEASDLSQRCKKQWECGSLRMVSVGIEIQETSTDASLMVAGQTLPTVVRCRLFEVSVVDVGSNPESIVLKRGGKVVNLCDGGDALSLLNDVEDDNNNNVKIEEMELKKIALALGLAETATEDDVMLACRNSVELKKRNDELTAELDRLCAGAVAELVDVAVADGRIDAGKREHFVELGKNVGVDCLRETLSAMQPRVKLSAITNVAGGVVRGEWKKLSDVPSDQILELKATDAALYSRLYEAEYGMPLKQ